MSAEVSIRPLSTPDVTRVQVGQPCRLWIASPFETCSHAEQSCTLSSTARRPQSAGCGQTASSVC